MARHTLAAALLALGLALTLAAEAAPATATAVETPVGTSADEGAVSASRGTTTVTKLLVFVVENHSLDQMRDEMPFTARLARRYGYATSYHGVTHPSLPNYLAIAGGDTFGVSDDAAPSAHPLTGPSVFGRAVRAGSTARLYAEAMG